MKETFPDRVRLGVFEVDLRAGELRQDSGAIVLLPDQPLQILRMLIEADGQIVTREQIQQKLWPDDTVVEFGHSISTAVGKLRRALIDSVDEPQYIQTISKRGYRLLVPVERIETVAGRDADWNLEASSTLSETAKGENGSVGGNSPKAGKRKRVTAVTLACVSAVTAVVVYGRLHRSPKLASTGTIVLTDFANSTGDPVFDGTLKQGLSVQLEQSPFLVLLSDRKVSETLKQMGRPPGESLAPEVAHDVCLRTNGAAMITGSITTLGKRYVIGLRAIDCYTGDLLAEAQEEAPGKEAVLDALGTAAASLRGKLGESLASVQRYDTPLVEATTPSLEALQAYSLARNSNHTRGGTAALPLLKHAIELDPNFALPYAALSVVYSNLNQSGLAEENGRKAYELRDKVSERERFFIEANYYSSVTGDLEKAQQAYETWQQIYPREQFRNLGFVYSTLGKWEKALEIDQESLRQDPSNVSNYINIGIDFQALNRFPEAASAYKQAQQRGLDSVNLLVNRYSLAFLEGDAAQMAQLVSATEGKAGVEDLMLATQGDTEAWHGRWTSARQLTRRAMDLALRNDAKEAAAAYQAEMALREAESGRHQQTRADALEAVKLAPNRDVRSMAALALAKSGDIGEAERLAGELSQAYPQDTLVQRYWLPAIRAALALQRNEPERAIEELQSATFIELGQASEATTCLCPAFVRGDAYLMLRDGKAAAAEFQKFIEHRGLAGNFPWGALARLGLARAYKLEAQTDPNAGEKARAAYQDFLAVWKQCDSDIPIYQHAKEEYANLQ